ncbi:MAG: hypothetical protein AB7F28_03640 [Candidatus Margulisiibacteriota bacterium]
MLLLACLPVMAQSRTEIDFQIPVSPSQDLKTLWHRLRQTALDAKASGIGAQRSETLSYSLATYCLSPTGTMSLSLPLRLNRPTSLAFLTFETPVSDTTALPKGIQHYACDDGLRVHLSQIVGPGMFLQWPAICPSPSVVQYSEIKLGDVAFDPVLYISVSYKKMDSETFLHFYYRQKDELAPSLAALEKCRQWRLLLSKKAPF